MSRLLYPALRQAARLFVAVCFCSSYHSSFYFSPSLNHLWFVPGVTSRKKDLIQKQTSLHFRISEDIPGNMLNFLFDVLRVGSTLSRV